MNTRQADVLIAGAGIAGLMLARALEARGRSVLIVHDPARPSASAAAVGLLNPVIGQRFTLAWMAARTLPLARAVYARIAAEAGAPLFRELPIVRILRNETERAAWENHAAAIVAAGFPAHEIAATGLGLRVQEFGAVRIAGGGCVDAAQLIRALQQSFRARDRLIESSLLLAELEVRADLVRWPAQNVEAGALVLATGARVANGDSGASDLRDRETPPLAGPAARADDVSSTTPSTWPVRAVKGESLLVQANGISRDAVYVCGHFLAPIGMNNQWICGATLAPGEDQPTPTDAARAELEQFLRERLETSWSMVEQRAGVRPVTPDQRPIAGRLRPDAPVFGLNGLGTRGLTLAPWIAELMAAYLIDGTRLPAEISPERFATAPPKGARWHAVDLARAAVLTRIRPGDTALDLTVGNGGDALWLAEAVGARGCVLGFDTQENAIVAARRRLALAEVEADVELFAADHALVDLLLPSALRGRIAAAVANLGHLPGSRSPIVTRPETTIAAFNATIEHWLAPGGVLVAVVYVGHAGGPEEHAALVQWSNVLDPTRYGVAWLRAPTNVARAPAVLIVEKKTG